MYMPRHTNRMESQSRGFTLVETLVAISILLVVIVGPMTVASRGMQSAFYASDQTTAIYLAQEAIEHIQKLRDDTALDNYDDYMTDGNDGDGDTWEWHDDLSSHCRDGDGCDVNFAASPITYRDCSTASSCVLNKYTGASPGDRVYGYSSGSGWAPSIFTRRIRVGDDTSANGVPVTVTVSWNSSLFGNTRTVTLQTYVYDVYNRFE
jgi:prepilin-type N-terminal cleavage/methylation domain-containing protein